MQDIQEGKTPNNGRRFDDGTNQSYTVQLGIRVNDLLLIFRDREAISIMDVGSFHSSASSELGSRIGKRIKTLGIDLQPPPEQLDIDEYLRGDLDSNDFLESLKKTQAGKDIILMNNVTQYLEDRLGVIKFLFDNILGVGGVFYFNIIPDYFFVSQGFSPIHFIDALENLWIEAGIDFTSQSTVFGLRAYKLIKKTDSDTIPVPEYRHSKMNNEGFKMARYNFRTIRK